MHELVSSARSNYTNIVSFVAIAIGAMYVAIFGGDVAIRYKLLLLLGVQAVLIVMIFLHRTAISEFKRYLELAADNTVRVYCETFISIAKSSGFTFGIFAVLNAVGLLLVIS